MWCDVSVMWFVFMYTCTHVSVSTHMHIKAQD